MGYGQVAEQGAGYPIGYLTCARTIGILGYKDTVGGTLSSQTAASLIKRALEAEMLEGKSYTNDSVKYSENGRTALFAKYKIIKETGIVNAYGKSALLPEYETADGHANIGGMSLESSINLFPYLGYRVEYYYSDDDEIILAVNPYKNYVTEIDAQQEPSLSGRRLSYFENDKKTYTDLPADISVVYNGKCKGDYTADDFDIDKGNIVLIENGGGDIAAVIINDYSSRIVKRVNSAELEIIGKADRDEKIDISKNTGFYVKAEDGSAVSAKDIHENDVLTVCISDDGKVVYGWLSRKTVQGEIAAKYDDNDDTYVEISGSEYKIDKELVKKKSLDIKSNGKFFIDHYGIIVWFDSAAMADDVAAIIKSSVKENGIDSGKVLIKMLCSTGEIKSVETAESFVLDGVKMNSVSAVPPALAKGNLMRYTLNADGQLKWIDSEVTSSAEDDGALTLMAPEENSCYLVGSFQGRYIPTSSTVIFKLPNLERDDVRDSDYRVGTSSTIGLNGDDIYVTKGYTAGKRYGTPDYMILRDASSSGSIAWNSPYNLVKNIRREYDKETGEVDWIVTVVTSSDEEDCYIDEKILTAAGYGTNADYSLTIGDIVQLSKSTAGNRKEILNLQVAWDCEKKELNPSARIYTSGGYTGFYAERELQYGELFWNEGEYMGMTRSDGYNPGKPAKDAQSEDIYYFKVFKNNLWVVDSRFKGDRDKYIKRADFGDFKDYQHYSDCSGVIFYAMRGTLMFVVAYN